MKHVMRTLARLYPRAWRRRYADEFEALLEDAGVTWRGAVDVLRGALMMHLNYRRSIRIVAVATILGLIIGTGASFLAPTGYSADIVFVITVPKDRDSNGAASNCCSIRSAVVSRWRDDGVLAGSPPR
jgi:hypothetical protein